MSAHPVFRQMAEGQYSLTIEPLGIVFALDRLRRERHELVGELTVLCPLSGAHAVTPDGLIHLADFNCSSAQVRGTRAKLLRERSEADLDWTTWIEMLCLQTIQAERAGTPARPLSQFERRGESPLWNICGWRLPKHHPAILFGDGGSLKSYFALLAAGMIAAQGTPTLLCDWELDGEDHHARLCALFEAEIPVVHYLRCDRPLVDEADRIRREVGRLGIEYLICDSVGFATPGPPESAEMAVGYFRALRQIGVGGTLHLAHSTKAATDGEHSRNPIYRGLKPFGSVFWHNSARSTWFARRSEDDDEASPVVVGLYHQKANTGPLLPAVGFSVQFSPGQTVVTPTDLSESPDLSVGLSLRQRIVASLRQGPKTIVALAEQLKANPDSVRRTLNRARREFVSVTQTDDGIHRWALLSHRTEDIH